MIREKEEEKQEKKDAGVGRMLAYYADVLEDAERVVEKLQEPLPCTFRVIPGVWEKAVEKKIAGCQLVQQSKWCPLVYEVPLSRKDISARGVKENVHGVEQKELEKVSAFLKTHFSGVYITRQETVSMIPVVALGVEKDSVVLDMCASPGSKSAQILEALGPEGVAVCNDVNRRRIDQLVTQTKRFGHPGLVVTCCDSTAYPRMDMQPNRVLCDVPCSGDGTARKNPHVFQKWSVKDALGLHRTQMRILERGFDLLAPNGTLVYSTCSLNPVENELVVLRVLAKRKDAEIVPFEVPGLVMREGLSEKALRACIAKTDPCKEIEWEAYLPEIRHARRIHPQDQNTGGFFVAKIRKKEESQGSKEESQGSAEEDRATDAHSLKDTAEDRCIRGTHEMEETCFYRVEQSVRERIQEEWGDTGLELISKMPKARTVYGASARCMRFLETAPKSLRVIFAGVRLFSLFGKTPDADRSKDRWRATYEGLSAFSPKPERTLLLPISECCRAIEAPDAAVFAAAGKKGMLSVSPTVGSVPLPIRIPFLVTPTEVSVLVEGVQKGSLLEILKTLSE